MGWIPDETPILESVFKDICDVDDIQSIFGYDVAPMSYAQLLAITKYGPIANWEMELLMGSVDPITVDPVDWDKVHDGIANDFDWSHWSEF